MQERPASISIISAWLIFSAVVSLVVNFTHRIDPKVIEVMSRNPIPIQIQIAWVYTGAVVSLVSGVALIKRQNWARFLYVIWSGLTLAVSFITSPVKAASLPGAVFLAIIVFFLFHPKVKTYFLVHDQEPGIKDISYSQDRQSMRTEPSESRTKKAA